jgi:myo-inositol 2-dehydrogenase / D-chiro-inositol 1-dehydrogenase
VKRRFGVGILGAGRAAQAIHLPALAMLADRFRVVHISDPNDDVAAAVAARVGARHSTTAAALLDDTAVDVVAVCSPDAVHAVQVRAACVAGKRAIVCEKPLAVSGAELREVVAVVEATGTPVVVGAMHVFDPAFVAARRHWPDRAGAPAVVRSMIHLPPTEAYVDAATELMVSERARLERSQLPPALPDAELLPKLLLGLGTHAAPLVRPFIGSVCRVDAARPIAPAGYVISFVGATGVAHLIACLLDIGMPQWTFDVWAAGAELRVVFPPPFVQAGSAVATLATAEGGRRTWGPNRRNGHVALWTHVADVAHGDAPPYVTMADQAADLDMIFELLPHPVAAHGGR